MTDASFSTRTVTTAGATASTIGAYDEAVSDPLSRGASAALAVDWAAEATAAGDCANPMLYPAMATSATRVAPTPARASAGRREKVNMARNSFVQTSVPSWPLDAPREPSHKKQDEPEAFEVLTPALHACNAGHLA